MKYCYACGHMTEGEPLYCNRCGRSYDIRLCPRSHENPRGAECCSQCGSRDLSTPQPKVPMSWRLLAILIRLGVGLLLFYATLQLLIALVRTETFHEILIACGVLLSALWALYRKLPDWLQDLLRFFWKRKTGSED